MDKRQLIALIADTVRDLDFDSLKIKGTLYKGKVRDVVDLGDKLMIYTSDRISAFDRILTTIPCKGEVLNRIALYWFRQTAGLMPNHVIKELSPRAVLVQKCKVIPLELIVRGYLTGSAWRDYEKGKPVSGIKLKPGLRYNEKFDTPLITPTTKAEAGHDLPISREEILKQQIVSPALWEEIETSALALFKKAADMVRARGLILVDTKFEFGLLDNKLVCVDEIFTPDSSRFWYLDTFDELFVKGEEQRKLDKEYLRKWLMDHDFMGDGDAPEIPEDIRAEVALRYIGAFENITGTTFKPTALTAGEEITRIADGLKKE